VDCFHQKQIFTQSMSDFLVLSALCGAACGAAVLINEIASSGAPNDWLELVNTGASTVDLAGWWLTDSDVTERQNTSFVFPAASTIEAGGFLVVSFLAATATASADALSTTLFRLSSDGETLALVSADGALQDRVTFADPGDSASVGRVPDGSATWFEFAEATRGTSNSGKPAGVAAVVRDADWRQDSHSKKKTLPLYDVVFDATTRSRFLHDPASLLGNDTLLDQFVDRMHAIVDRRYRVGERVQRERGHQRRGGAAARARSIPRHPRHRVLGDGALHQSVLGRAQGHHFSRGRRSDQRQARRRVRAEHLQEEALESRGTDMVVSNKSKKSTAPRFIVDIAAGTCSCGEPQTVGTACVHALVAIEAPAAQDQQVLCDRSARQRRRDGVRCHGGCRAVGADEGGRQRRVAAPPGVGADRLAARSASETTPLATRQATRARRARAPRPRPVHTFLFEKKKEEEDLQHQSVILTRVSDVFMLSLCVWCVCFVCLVCVALDGGRAEKRTERNKKKMRKKRKIIFSCLTARNKTFLPSSSESTYVGRGIFPALSRTVESFACGT